MTQSGNRAHHQLLESAELYGKHFDTPRMELAGASKARYIMALAHFPGALKIKTVTVW